MTKPNSSDFFICIFLILISTIGITLNAIFWNNGLAVFTVFVVIGSMAIGYAYAIMVSNWRNGEWKDEQEKATQTETKA